MPVLYDVNLSADPFDWARRTPEWRHSADRHLLPDYPATRDKSTHRTLHGISRMRPIGHPLPAGSSAQETLDRSGRQTVLGVVESFRVDLCAAQTGQLESRPRQTGSRRTRDGPGMGPGCPPG